MAYNIDFTTVLKAVKPESKSRTVDFPAIAAERTYNFRDSLKEAVRSRDQDDRKADDRTDLRKELASRSEAKLRSIKKPSEKDSGYGDGVEKAKDKKVIKSETSMEEMLSRLEELVKQQQLSEIPSDKQAALLESVKAALKELCEKQPQSIVPESTNLEAKAAELAAVLESMQETIAAGGSIADKEASVDFMKELKAIVEQLSSKAEEDKKTALGNKAAGLDSRSTINTTDALSVKGEEANNKAGQKLTPQGPENKAELAAESKTSNEAQDMQKQDIKNEAPAADIKQVGKETKPEAEEASEEVKAAVDSKVEKVTVESKETRKQDDQPGTKKETLKEAPKSTDTVHLKSGNEEAAAIRLNQATADNQAEAVQQQPASKPVPVTKAEVINQIVKKAEVTFNGEQSEMKMQLEPENLGRLTLKLAVEKGLITAKFVAESYEVKQIIESSFNELKDMLQEKGLEVQSFSVSVGQNNRENNNANAFQQWKETVRLNGRSTGRSTYEGYQDSEAAPARTVNPYSIHNGKFDYRA